MPSARDAARPPAPEPHLVLRVVSVIPFILAGAFGVIATVAWVAVLVLGAGTGRGNVLSWARGKPAGEVVLQVLLLVLIGVACAGVVVASIYATGYGVRAAQPRRFWFVAQAFFSVLGFLLLAGRSFAPTFMKEIGLTGREWFFAFGLVAFAMIVVGLRMRHEGDDEDGKEDGADG
jgi:hypothetical protein